MTMMTILSVMSCTIAAGLYVVLIRDTVCDLIEHDIMKTYILFLALVAVGCTEGQSGEQESASARSSVNRTMIKGIWWSPDMPQTAAFQVNDSTFYYPDHFKSLKYDILGDSLFVVFDDGYVSTSVIMKLTVDSLVLLKDGAEQLYTRAEPNR